MPQALTNLLVRDSQEQVLEQSRQFCRDASVPAALDAVPSLLLVLNKHRQIVFANRLVAQMLNVDSREELYGKRPGEVFECEHATDGSYGCGGSEACTACGASRAIGACETGAAAVHECHIHRSNMKVAMELRASTTPVTIDNSPFSIVVYTDISHENRRRTLERIFFHDLTNTLGALTGYVQLLEDAPAGTIKDYTESIMRLSNTLADEIRAQRDLSAAENNDLTLRMEPLHSHEFLEELASHYRNHPASRDRSIVIGSSAASIRLRSDRSLLRRVLGNMLKNALEATAAGQSVALHCDHSPDNRAVFSVHNHAFIPRDVQLQMFHRAFSTKGAGRGLGTYSMKLLGEKYLGGKIWFTSAPDTGTTFFASLPADPA